MCVTKWNDCFAQQNANHHKSSLTIFAERKYKRGVSWHKECKNSLSASLPMHLKNSPRSNFRHVSLVRQIVWHANSGRFCSCRCELRAPPKVRWNLHWRGGERCTFCAAGAVRFGRRRQPDARKYEKCFHFLLIAARAIVCAVVFINLGINLLTPAESSSGRVVFSFWLFKCLGECIVIVIPSQNLGQRVWANCSKLKSDQMAI
jgi:hypothetical protein